MSYRTVVATCLVPSALRKEDIEPYVARKFAGVGGFLGHVELLSWCPAADREKTWVVRVKLDAHKDGIPVLSQRPIVRLVEEYRPAPPPSPPRSRDPDDDDWEPSGVLASPGPLRQPYATIAKVFDAVVATPFVAAIDGYHRLRSRVYRDWF